MGKGFDVQIAEIDVAPVQIQGPKSVDLMRRPVRTRTGRPALLRADGSHRGRATRSIISQTGFTGEKGYEIYLRDATLHAEDMWNAVLEAGKPHQLKVIAPAHHRRVAAGILSWGQDMDAETLPFQVNLGYQVPRKKEADYVGKAALEAPATRSTRVAAVPHEDGGAAGRRQAHRRVRPGFLAHPRRAGRRAGRLPHLTVVVPRARDQHRPRLGARRPVGGRHQAGGQPARPVLRHPGVPVDATVVEVPFRPSVNPNQRELLKERGLDAAV